jgi:hypothetical protein
VLSVAVETDFEQGGEWPFPATGCSCSVPILIFLSLAATLIAFLLRFSLLLVHHATLARGLQANDHRISLRQRLLRLIYNGVHLRAGA